MKGIYQYKDLKTGDVVYVGKDSHIDKNQRHNNHLYPSNYDKQPFNRIIQNNPDKYEYSILCSGEYSDLQLNKLERLFIKIFNPKFNFTTGGDGCDYWKGKTFSEEHKLNISKSINTSGYYKVSKLKRKDYKQGFFWEYEYVENGKRKRISSVSIEKLKEKVKAKGLEWREL